MNAKVKAIIERHKDDLDKYGNGKSEFRNILGDAYNENVWNEMLDTLKEAGIILVNEDIDMIFKECERKRLLAEANKAREAGFNNNA